jgi:transposase
MNVATHSSSELLPSPVTDATTLRCSPTLCTVCPLLADHLELRQQAGYWKALHHRAVTRLNELQAENEQLRAQLRLRERQLFERKSEKTCTPPPSLPVAAVAAVPKRTRGQQRGRPSPPRRRHDQLPVVEEVVDVAAEQQHCPRCGQNWLPFPGTEDAELLEIDVRAYRRIYRRRRYRPGCVCGVQPGIISAPPPPKVLPKSHLGLSVWVTLLLDKYRFGRPTHRLLEDLRSHGLDLSLGTVTDGLRRLTPLFEPLYEGLIEQQRQEHHWHADETRWLVFATLEGKVGHRWYLWAVQSAQAVVFLLDPSRSHDVPEEHLGAAAFGILNVDRYSAYKAMTQVKEGRILLAFCWAHVRRDFLAVARDWPTQEDWGLRWVADIGELYHLNNQRLAARADPLAFAQRHELLRAAIERMAQRCAQERGQPDLHPARRKVLESLQEHWAGLTVFVTVWDVPMDNNAVERTLRGPVVGRKNYSGSGSLWSGWLAAMLFSVLHTVERWDLNPRLWLTAYLEACAAAGGQAPADAERFLPWRLSAAEKRRYGCEMVRTESG